MPPGDENGDQDADAEPLDISGRRPQIRVQAAAYPPSRPEARPPGCSSSEVSPRSPRSPRSPPRLLAAEIGSYDRKVARRLERSSSSQALAPWMRPPTPGEGGAPMEVPWQEPAPAAAPTLAQPQAATPRRVREGGGMATSM